MPSSWHVVHLGSRAVGGAGLVMCEATAVSPEGRISPWDTGIWNDDQANAWKDVTEFIREHGALSAIQLAHAGRKASNYRSWSGQGAVSVADGGWEPVSATSEAFPDCNTPHELTTEEVYASIQDWIDAGIRSVAAGFDVLEIHSAHGYLVHQFLSPITNQRTDEFGGSLEKRAKYLVDIVSGIRQAVGEEIPIIVRFSATDYREDGFTVSDCAQVAKLCEEVGADVFDISSGGLVLGVKIPFGPGYQVPMADEVAGEVDSPVAAVGLIAEY
jgi:2,4-dienoyl-CoA reductase-like NADH-dependent reductase (Old Yellow Enzyme family)